MTRILFVCEGAIEQLISDDPVVALSLEKKRLSILVSITEQGAR